MPGSALNPPITLTHPPHNGCLHEADGRPFSTLLQTGRLSANLIAHRYPAFFRKPHLLDTADSSPMGKALLSHLSAVMYTYWDAAPSGPSAFQLTINNLNPPLTQLCRTQCLSWGTHRLNAPVNTELIILKDTPAGSIVADPTMNTFYRVLGLKSSPAAALSKANITLPAATRLTALPFRGVLVYDGIIGGASKPRSLDPHISARLHARYEQALRDGTVVTGFHAPTPDSHSQHPSDGAAYDMAQPLQDNISAPLSTKEEELVARLKAASKEKAIWVFRRVAYSEDSNPDHIVTVIKGLQPVAVFQSLALVPSKAEILNQLAKLASLSSVVLPKRIAVDDKDTAQAVARVTKQAGITTGYYPEPSVEEISFLNSVSPPLLVRLKSFGSA